MTPTSFPVSFSEVLPALFERIYAHETTFLDCVVPVVDALRVSTGWDRAVYSEVRRVPQYSEVVYMSELPGLPRPLLAREIPCPDFSALDFAEKIGGAVEVSVYAPAQVPGGITLPEGIRVVEQQLQAYLRANEIQRAVYAPRRLTPNFAPVITLHRCLEDAPLSDSDREALKLAHIVLKEIIQRKRWRFRIPGHSADHDRIMPMLAAGWDSSRIATTLERSIHEVRAMRDHIMIELENQYGIRSPEAAIIFLRGELAKPV